MPNNSEAFFRRIAMVAVASGIIFCGPVARDAYAVEEGPQVVSASRMLEYLQNQLITMDLKDADLGNVLRIIAAQYNLNIVAGAAVEGKVTVSFKEATLEGALRSLLLSNGYG